MPSTDYAVTQFSPLEFDSPLVRTFEERGGEFQFVSEADRVPHDLVDDSTKTKGLGFERAGPRREIYFDPSKTRAAIVTCGGLCPGINDVIRGLVITLYHWYGARDVLGIHYGFNGLSHYPLVQPSILTTHDVSEIHQRGGTILGASRGAEDVGEMVDRLVELDVGILFCIGGDGTLKGAHALAQEILSRDLKISIVGIPKTIDNDIPLVYRSFGFQTAVEEAANVLRGAHVEARGHYNGVGLVKLMGRAAGFIAAYATLASGDVNFCLTPEVPLVLDGDRGFLAELRKRLDSRHHAVIALAEGVGANLIGKSGEQDASGNVRFKDIGRFLKDRIIEASKQWGEPVEVKYFDPAYSIRSVPANSSDSIFCSDLARFAVNAAMAGKTDLLIGQWHGVFTHVPLAALEGRTKHIGADSGIWRSVVSVTGQPAGWEV